MVKQRIFLLTWVLVVFVIFGLNQTISYGDTTKALNTDGIANTRHNLSIDWLGANSQIMDVYRNDYDRICVYCHTPHGANSQLIEAPLWNRTYLGNSHYILYTDPDSGRELGSGQLATNPGVSSLTCLSCHDGTLAIDSIINMPGSGMYDVAQEDSQNNDFLSTWENPSGVSTFGHATLEQCRSICHNPSSFVGGIAPDFGVFVIGEDLTNDHPIGVHLPSAENAQKLGYNEPTAVDGNKWFFDLDEDGRADRNEIRLYYVDEVVDEEACPSCQFEVECASCHDPHGVPIAGPGNGGPLAGTFLRIQNSGSSVCLTCHIK